MIRRAYVDIPTGQLHYRRADPPPGLTPRGTVVLFHETPTSSIEYTELMRELARDRVAVAVDTPGFGGSDPIAGGPVPLQEYARVVATALESLHLPRPLAVFGFHTGAGLAVELAVGHPSLVDVVLLGGVPLRTPDERAERLAALPRDKGTDALKARLDEYWQLTVGRSPALVAPDRAMDQFVSLVEGRHTYWWAYDALWRYPLDEKLAEIRQPALVLAPHEMLYEQTLRAAKRIPGARLVEFPKLTEFVLDVGAAEIAREMGAFIDESAGRRPGKR